MQVFSRIALWACALALGCGEGGSSYEGQSGQPVEVRLFGDVPSVAASFGESRDVPLLIDVGSPLTVLSQRSFTDLFPGTFRGVLSTFALRFRDFHVAVERDLFGAPGVCAEGTPGGLVGMDLLRPFRLAVDHRAGRATLFDGPRPDPMSQQGVEPAQELPFELRGGGSVNIGGQQRLVGATRVVVAATIEGVSTHAVVDSGASLTLLDGQLFGQLSSDRPVACCTTLFLAEAGEKRVVLTRLARLGLGDVQIEQVPAAVLPNGLLTSSLATETGRQIGAIIGGSALRLFASHLDFEERRWTLQRYTDATHVDPLEYVLPGFSVCKGAAAQQGFIVTEVYEQTDAAAQGVQSGEIVIALSGQDVRGLEVREFMDLLHQTDVGQKVSLTFRTDSGEVTRELMMEQLL